VPKPRLSLQRLDSVGTLLPSPIDPLSVNKDVRVLLPQEITHHQVKQCAQRRGRLIEFFYAGDRESTGKISDAISRIDVTRCNHETVDCCGNVGFGRTQHSRYRSRFPVRSRPQKGPFFIVDEIMVLTEDYPI
jgi:hypothetical protein